MFRKLAFGIGSSVCVLVAACSGGETARASFPSDDGTGDAGGGVGDNGLGGGNTPVAPVNGDLTACATSATAAKPRPVFLVFMYDKSGSMTQDGKWDACKAATKAFLEGPESTGLSASLTFFPTGADICRDGEYATPAVAVQKLPSKAFGGALDNYSPDGDTPTRAALSGALTYARGLASGVAKNGRIAVVLVTDGVPENCDGNTIADVRAVAASASPTIPTYVIGVGSELGNLNTIAQGGGTGAAILVQTGDPEVTRTGLLAAITSIKESALACDYEIPPPPAGASFDRARVNVQYTSPGGAPSTLPYNATCDGGQGWTYDDQQNPTRVLACGGTCDNIKATNGKVDIVFGCATQSIVK